MTAQQIDVHGWIAFADRWPNESQALDDPSIKTTDRVLVTNNIAARDWRQVRRCIEAASD